MTIAIRERYVVDEKGRRVGVLLDIGDYRRILDELEELESIRAYDVAKASGDEAIPFEQAIEEIERLQKALEQCRRECVERGNQNVQVIAENMSLRNLMEKKDEALEGLLQWAKECPPTQLITQMDGVIEKARDAATLNVDEK